VPTVLVVEDDEDAAEPLVMALRKTGYRVLSVPNGREALAILILNAVDLVITDLRMPEMDGVTLLGVLRSYLRFRSLPVIVFSAYTEGRNGEQLSALGVSEVFRKGSADLAVIVSAVGRHLRPASPETSNN
jgi:two-component system, NtrC family, sensor kinase